LIGFDESPEVARIVLSFVAISMRRHQSGVLGNDRRFDGGDAMASWEMGFEAVVFRRRRSSYDGRQSPQRRAGRTK
jgi:hypothetical protein